MAENHTSRLVRAFQAFGVLPTKAAGLAGLHPNVVKQCLNGEPVADGTVLKLEAALEKLARERLQMLADLAMFGDTHLGIIKAVEPSASILGRLFAVEMHNAATAGWPRRLAPAEQAELLKDSDAKLAEILAREEAERRELEESFALDAAWSAPPDAK